jgi:ubiquinone/menaquinone biosynthesis C-methylase UbiE
MFPRQHQPEWMDAPGVDRAELEHSLQYIKRVNRIARYTKATISHLEQFSRGWKPDETITILDVATGSADVPAAIVAWADRKRLPVHVTGVDLHPITLSVAQREVTDPRITLLRADAMELPFADGSFDYAMTSMFLHHLSEDEVVKVMQEMNRVSRRGVIIADLVRDRRALTWITLLTLFATPMIQHDARVSIKQSFTREEIEALRDRAGVSYARYHRHFAHRFVLAGEKEKSQQRAQVE